jgi:hypothetical protein
MRVTEVSWPNGPEVAAIYQINNELGKVARATTCRTRAVFYVVESTDENKK